LPHELPLETWLLMVFSWTLFSLTMVAYYVYGLRKGLWEGEDNKGG